jgi:hypothetical protein
MLLKENTNGKTTKIFLEFEIINLNNSVGDIYQEYTNNNIPKDMGISQNAQIITHLITRKYPQQIDLHVNCFCNKIELIDFPPNTYGLNYLSTNLLTSTNFFTFENITNEILDPKNLFNSSKLVKELGELKSDIKIPENIIGKLIDLSSGGFSIGLNNYNNIYMNDSYKIKLEGLFYINDKWVWKNEIMYWYPKNLFIGKISGNVTSIDLELKISNINYESKIYVCIDTDEFSYTLDKNILNQKLKIKFKNPNGKYLCNWDGSQTAYLSQEMIQNSVCFNRVFSINFVLFNCELIGGIKNSFDVYKKVKGNKINCFS